MILSNSRRQSYKLLVCSSWRQYARHNKNKKRLQTEEQIPIEFLSLNNFSCARSQREIDISTDWTLASSHYGDLACPDVINATQYSIGACMTASVARKAFRLEVRHPVQYDAVTWLGQTVRFNEKCILLQH